MSHMPTQTRASRRLRRQRRRRLRHALSAALAAILAAASASVGLAIAGTPWTNGIFADDLKPQIEADPDRAPVELGVRFTPQHEGQVTALQYYQGRSASDVTTATLWSAWGRALARVNFPADTREGWRTIPLTKPVRLRAGETYVVSYHAPRGGYVVTEQDLTTRTVQNGFVLEAGAGVYRYGQHSRFPTQSYRGSNYLVDIVYDTQHTTPPRQSEPAGSEASTSTHTPTPTPTPTFIPTATSTPTVRPTPTQSSSPTPGPSQPPTNRFPTRQSAGLPAGWTPAREVTGDYRIQQAGAVVEDLRVINGTIIVDAPNVTLQRIEGIGATVYATRNACANGFVIQDSTLTASSRTSGDYTFAVGPGGYTARNIVVDGVPEGLRVSGDDYGCGPVTVEDSYVRVVSPTECGDWHGDGIQGYYGGHLTVRNSTVILDERQGCWGTAAFFYPDGQGNTSVDIDGLLVSGGGYPFRNRMPGSVRNLNVVDGSWGYGPVDVKCSVVSPWQAQVVRLDAAGQPVPIQPIKCA